MQLLTSSWLLWSPNDFLPLHVLFFGGEGAYRGGRGSLRCSGHWPSPAGCLMHLFLLVPLHRGLLRHHHHLLPPLGQHQHFYLGMVHMEPSLFGRADISWCKIEKMLLSTMKTERGEDLRLWRRLTPVPPAPGPLLVSPLSMCSNTSSSGLVHSPSESPLPSFLSETFTLL